MENYLKQQLKEGKMVSVKIDVGYPDSSGLRPSGFFVKAEIDGEVREFPFKQ